MFTELNIRLERVKDALEHERKWQRHLEELAGEQSTKQQEVQKLEARLAQQQQVVDKLNGLSLSSLFYTLLGRKEQRLEDEDQLLLQTKLQYDEASATLSDIQTEKTELKRMLLELGNPQDEYKTILQEKERLIHDSASPMSEALFALYEEKADKRAYLTEIHEAQTAAERVRRSLDQTREVLQSASNWGTYDMLGGGMLSTMIKHSRIDEAKQHVHEAQRHMRALQKELQDVGMQLNIQFDTGGMLKFADFFFDGLIVDWMVQGRIRNSREQVEDALRQIRTISSKLAQEKAANEQAIEGLRGRIASMLEGA